MLSTCSSYRLSLDLAAHVLEQLGQFASGSGRSVRWLRCSAAPSAMSTARCSWSLRIGREPRRAGAPSAASRAAPDPEHAHEAGDARIGSHWDEVGRHGYLRTGDLGATVFRPCDIRAIVRTRSHATVAPSQIPVHARTKLTREGERRRSARPSPSASSSTVARVAGRSETLPVIARLLPQLLVVTGHGGGGGIDPLQRAQGFQPRHHRQRHDGVLVGRRLASSGSMPIRRRSKSWTSAAWGARCGPLQQGSCPRRRGWPNRQAECARGRSSGCGHPARLITSCGTPDCSAGPISTTLPASTPAARSRP